MVNEETGVLRIREPFIGRGGRCFYHESAAGSLAD